MSDETPTMINPELEFYRRLNELVIKATGAGMSWDDIVEDLRVLANAIEREDKTA